MSVRTTLFPPLEPYRSGTIAVDELHTLYWEESGNPRGVPVLFLHGGPGAQASPVNRQLFDPDAYRIVLFDQRGAGRSTPMGECLNNTTQLLIADIERLRKSLEIDQWLVCGGSWGSTLALAYGEAHPLHCAGFLLRGILLGTDEEIDWFLNGPRLFVPEAHADFVRDIGHDSTSDILRAYLEELFADDPTRCKQAAQRWYRYAESCASLRPDLGAIDAAVSSPLSVGVARVHAHFLAHQLFLEPDQLLRNIGRIRHLPAAIVQGRYDLICPPAAAFRLKQAWPDAALHIAADSGHASTEPAIQRALLIAAEQFKTDRAFDADGLRE